MDFKQAVEDAAKRFKQESAISQGKVVGIISHNDADGVTSAAIIAETLSRLDVKFHLIFIKRTEQDIGARIALHSYPIYLLLDYGTREVEDFSKLCPDKKFYVLDHHITKAHGEEFKDKIFDINPILYGVDGATEISAAGVCYLFSKVLDEKNKDLSVLAVIGARGDMQAKSGHFIGKNVEILEDAKSIGLIEVKKGLNVYGWTARPLHKALEYSVNPYIPDVTGSESKAVQFLQELGIELKQDGEWRTINDLSEDELKKLASGIILKRHQGKDAGNIFADKLFLPKFKIKDLSEADVLSAWLNSLGKLGKFGLAVGVALENQKCYEESKEHIEESKKELVKAMQYFYDNEDNETVVRKTKNATYFFCGNKVNPELASTTCTILSNNLEQEGMPLICFSDAEEVLKVSARLIGVKNPKNINLGAICSSVSAQIGGEGGGHKPAAGANLPKGKEESFINLVENELENKDGQKENKTETS